MNKEISQLTYKINSNKKKILDINILFEKVLKEIQFQLEENEKFFKMQFSNMLKEVKELLQNKYENDYNDLVVSFDNFITDLEEKLKKIATFETNAISNQITNLLILMLKNISNEINNSLSVVIETSNIIDKYKFNFNTLIIFY
ncbi:hypothetical protein C1646_766057 [Rhizophagus diaphanus]|nr:hypothetical protein C1646_766057 [Rhizophagus diaphanus] [Rhizophagus sp. MUCL 43196]